MKSSNQGPSALTAAGLPMRRARGRIRSQAPTAASTDMSAWRFPSGSLKASSAQGFESRPSCATCRSAVGPSDQIIGTNCADPACAIGSVFQV